MPAGLLGVLDIAITDERLSGKCINAEDAKLDAVADALEKAVKCSQTPPLPPERPSAVSETPWNRYVPRSDCAPDQVRTDDTRFTRWPSAVVAVTMSSVRVLLWLMAFSCE